MPNLSFHFIVLSALFYRTRPLFIFLVFWPWSGSSIALSLSAGSVLSQRDNANQRNKSSFAFWSLCQQAPFHYLIYGKHSPKTTHQLSMVCVSVRVCVCLFITLITIESCGFCLLPWKPEQYLSLVSCFIIKIQYSVMSIASTE